MKNKDKPFMKFDQGKIRYTLLEPNVIKELVTVLEFGARKYEKNNWKKLNIKEKDRYLDAALRHIEAYRCGEEFDSETDLPHIVHAMCNLMFLRYFDMKRRKRNVKKK